MRRALGRAYRRVRGDHPRRPSSASGRTVEIFCDVLLILAAVAFLAGVGLIVWFFLTGFSPLRLIGGVVLLGLGPVLLLLWEWLAWEPFAKRFSQL